MLLIVMQKCLKMMTMMILMGISMLIDPLLSLNLQKIFKIH